MGFLFGWIIFSLFVALIGSDRKIGFGSTLLISLFLSPLIGLIVALTSKTVVQIEKEENNLIIQNEQINTLRKMNEGDSEKNISFIDELEKLNKLKDSGAIDEEEFLVLKQKIINSLK